MARAALALMAALALLAGGGAAAATTTAAAPATGRRRALSGVAAEPQAAPGASLADAPPDDAGRAGDAALPSGQGPLYSTTATIAAALERWAGASSSKQGGGGGGGRLSLLKVADPLGLPPGAPDGSPSYGASLTALRFTDPSVPSEAKRRAVLTCSTHARELITGETCFALARLLAGADDGVAAAAASASSEGPSAPLWRWREMREAMARAGLLTRAEAASAPRAAAAFKARVAARAARELDLAILPVVNAAGRDAIERGGAGSYALRKAIDARDPDGRPQVDPNRSYPWNWRPSAEGAEDGETYSGANAAWPWEVRAVASLLGNEGGAVAGAGAKRALDAAIDVHSGIHALLFPPGHTCDLAGLGDDGGAGRLDLWQRASDAARGAWGDIITGPTSAALYVAAGTTMEYAHGALGARLASTPEVYSGDGEGKHQSCPTMAAWASACAGSAEVYGGACACGSGDAPAAACQSSVAADGDGDGAAGARRRRPPSSSSSSSSPGFGGGELTPAEVLLEAQRMRAAGDAAAAEAAERDAARRLGFDEGGDLPFARAAARAYWGAARYDRAGGGGADPGEASSAHYQPGKWPAGVTPGVDLADAIQTGDPVRNSGEQWYARDPYLRHWPRATRRERGTFAAFNPTTSAEFRRTVSDYATGILAMLLTA
jgi:hypothetical protein